MCGRFTLAADPRKLARAFDLFEVPDLPPRYNVAPGQPVATVGLKADGRTRVRTCCVLTTAPNAVVRPVHERMPVVLPEGAWEAWLDPATPAAELRRLLAPLPAERLTSLVVGAAVNSATNDGPECVRPGGRPGHVAAWAEGLT